MYYHLDIITIKLGYVNKYLINNSKSVCLQFFGNYSIKTTINTKGKKDFSLLKQTYKKVGLVSLYW